ncbi:MAG: DoxX family protein [Mycobacterium sp.]
MAQRTAATVETRGARYTASALGILRILTALLWAVHGTAGVFGWPNGTPAAFGSWPAWWAGALEIVLGVLIAIGLCTRAAAFVSSGMMAVAYFWIHFPEEFWPNANDGEPAVLFCFVFLFLVVAGPGAFSVSEMVGRRRT